MVAKINRMFLLCLAVLLTTAQSTAQQEITFDKFEGTYIVGHSFGGSYLTLESGGNYSTSSGSDDGTVIDESGTYIFSNGVLRFTAVKRVGRRMGNGKELNLLDPNEHKEMFGESVTGEIETTSQLLPIIWSERIYLIYEKDLDDFANAINLGLEPRSTLSSEPYYGSFHLRKGDEQKKVTGNPTLPPKWLSFLLSRPVTATVINVLVSRKDSYTAMTTATINKGGTDELKVGMRLISDGEEPSPWSGTEIVSVGEKTATVRANSILKVGDLLSTREEAKLDEYSALSWDEEKVRLGKFAARLNLRPGAMGYIIAYAGRRARAGEALARAERARAYLEKELKMEEGRCVVVDGGYREKQAVELFAVAITPWTKFPEPTPTINPAQVQIIKEKVD